ncbi:MAG: 2OG-Fe(II) oxygenase [Vulcanimicrobiota bacterium]
MSLRPIHVIADVIANHAELVALAEQHKDLFLSYPRPEAAAARPADWTFDPYRDTEYEDEDRYAVLQQNQMPPELVRAVVAGAFGRYEHFRPGSYYFQINRYDRGGYVLPHRDELQQGLYVLTSSAQDGLTVQDEQGGFRRIYDQAGTFILNDANAWHWVDPVVQAPRYTLLTIPPVWDFDDL